MLRINYYRFMDYIHEHEMELLHGRVLIRECTLCHTPRSLSAKCRSCNFRICQQCGPAFVNHPLHHHPLAYMKTASGHPDCSVCGKNVTGEWSMCSRRCSFFMCRSCHHELPKIKLETTMRSVRDHEHLLKQAKWNQHSSRGFRCMMCKQGNTPSKWICEPCQYTLCEACCQGDSSSVPSAKTEGDPCGVCLDQPRDSCFIHYDHTGHLFSCYSCAVEVHQRGMGCPVCRKDIRSVVRVY